MTDSKNICRLRCSVSGGLEALAEREVRLKIRGAAVVWLNRGKSGSQLEIYCQPSNILGVMRLRFVEYVYVEVGSAEVLLDQNNEIERIQRIKEIAASILQVHNFDACIHMWRTAQAMLSDRRDLGLEALPGVLLPTLQIHDAGDDSEIREAHVEGEGNAFVVNTIYTKSKVAQAVVSVFRELVEDHLPGFLEETVVWLDAGAGSGALLQHLPAKGRIGIDIQPSVNPEVHVMDFLSVTQKWILKKALSTKQYERIESHHVHLCILSNPPFAEHSRGDYSAVVKFINHAIHLDADFIGLIVPDKFARRRVWQSLGMNPRARLLARCLLPMDSFYDPSSLSCRHINTYFLFFSLKGSPARPLTGTFRGDSDISNQVSRRIRVEGKRNKSDFPWIATAELRDAVISSIRDNVVELNALDATSLVLSAELKALDNSGASRLEVYALLNFKQPLSLANCTSRRIQAHSLGWLSSSTKPPTAFAMLDLARTSVQSLRALEKEDSSGWASEESDHKESSIFINAMCGEGTIELESQSIQTPCFMIAGDKNEDAVKRTAERLASLHDCQGSLQDQRGFRPVDLVIWDAQCLPLRSGIADVFLADLPFVGCKGKKHQEPCLSGNAMDSALDYKRVMAQAARVLKSKGRAALLSADTNALSHAILQFNAFWSVLCCNNMNLGGLAGKLFMMEKHKQSSKDFSLWVSSTPGIVDESDALKRIAVDACSGFHLNDMLEIEPDDSKGVSPKGGLVLDVQLISSFFNEERSMMSHCYRIWFDSCVSNVQAKQFEKMIRIKIAEHPPVGMQLR